MVVAGLSSVSLASDGAIEARLSAVVGDSWARVAKEATDHARRALEQSRLTTGAGDQARAERARAIADAALTLAERQVARARTRDALRKAQERLLTVRARVTAEAETVEQLLRQRAEVARQERIR